MKDIELFKTDVYNTNDTLKIPHKMTVDEYHTMTKMMKLTKNKLTNPTHVFMGDVEQCSYEISFDTREYRRITKDEVIELYGDTTMINNIYWNKYMMKKYKEKCRGTLIS